MKFFFFILSIAISVCACKQSAVKKSFSSADSLVIYFKNEKMGAITKTVQTTESKAISRIIEFIDAKETKLFDCGYDGKMFFYSEGRKIQDVDFKMLEDSCNRFAFVLDGKLISTRMRNEAVDFLGALESGMPYYY